MERFIVVCTVKDGSESKLVLATRTAFLTKEDAADYVAGVSPSWNPQIIECPLGVSFREDSAARFGSN